MTKTTGSPRQNLLAATLVTPARLRTIESLPFFLRLAFRLLMRLRYGALDLTLPDGRRFRFEGVEDGPHAVMELRDTAVARRFFTGGDLGAAEAFLEGMWTTPDVTAFLQLVEKNKHALQRHRHGFGLLKLMARLRHLARRNSRSGSKRNIEYHYDLGNHFYRRWLDPSMTYSSAHFAHPDQPLPEAQENKYRMLAERIDLKPEHELLEIGCGWGGFAEFAAREIGCRVTGITISKEQLAFARERMEKAGLSDRVEIRYQDYRDVEEKYDRVASIEMFEAVGEQYWPSYFDTLHRCLKPGGVAGLQIITINDVSFTTYRRRADFIQRYIFPGGMLPSPSALRDQVTRAGLTWVGNFNFGLDYAETLKQWRERFLGAWPEIQPMGFDDRFRRMWEFYLSYCEAGFRTGNIDVTQVTLARPAKA